MLLDQLDGLRRTTPANKLELLVLERVGRLEKLLQLRHGPGRQVTNILQIAFERGPVWHGEDAVVSLFVLALLLLLQFEDADGLAAKHHARIGVGVVDHEDIEWVAVLRFRGWNKA